MRQKNRSNRFEWQEIANILHPQTGNPEKQINSLFTLSALSLVLIVADRMTNLPLLYVALPILIYVFVMMSVKYFFTASKRNNIPLAILDILGNGGPLVTGYFFASAFLSTTYYAAQKLMLKTEDHSRKGLVSIFGEQPRTITILEGGTTKVIPLDDLAIGQSVLIHAGGMIPIDGQIIEGEGRIDQRSLTGEFQPVEKGVGDKVLAGTILLSSKLTISVEKAGQDSTAAQITEALNATADFKSGLQSRGEMIMNKGAIPTLMISAIAFFTVGVEGALGIFFAAFGYHMRFSAPISVLNFLRIASRNGILIKDGRSLERLSEVDTVVFDKTGTLTEDQPTVAAVYPFGNHNEQTVLRFAAAAEAHQNHPIALAIVEAAAAHQLSLPEVGAAAYEIGYGLAVDVAGKETLVGSQRLLASKNVPISDTAKGIEQTCSECGHSLVFVSIGGDLAGTIELKPSIRPEVVALSAYLHRRGTRRVIISGDRDAPTCRLAEDLGFEDYFAEILPEGKADLVKQLRDQGRKICFVGDGINDSIALKTADVSISLSGANAIATDTAGVILMDGTLRKLEKLLDISMLLSHNLKVATMLSFIPGVICLIGVFFFNISLVTAMLIYNVGLAVSLVNALLPWLHEKLTERSSKSASV